ncbi:flagellar hook-associated protein FlgL [Clostridium tagluense]|uniref:flagellar hook-associated protein FlgL n=1 Tax=Clostridium tagluense TaxID=360422 RepID=UPI001CF51B7D|nr:flagellar hook-associated protein FlgL [Clostridium tagluense]MCB2310043.1 flagellar hook-associated protein FlgL [Clostridium tagluense]MCB2314427.1 flagellar hook-associated protein FlgL [Clostridium tagluense]MCB2319273.1 flagellar hook-associated protein FlgL [Clostridium tagluense]MCB2324637.1 flagellar hook-associated protein FlgL [Clostridium tagluense]MCB2329488.1 flagellar hook-associated protein FlgL [Clostridium tagluense]
MRVTNKMLSNNFLRDMRTNLTNMSRIQGQMTSGKEITKASDDPFKSSRIMQMYTDIDSNKQYNSNIKNSINWLDTTDTALSHAGNVVGRIEELLVSAGNGGYGSEQRQAIKDEINQRIQEVSQILNTSFDGKYIFGGTDGTSKPVGTGKDLLGNDELICSTKVVGKPMAGGMTYSGATVDANKTFSISINGEVPMKTVTLSTAITSGTTTMKEAETILQTSIKATIDKANTDAGITIGQPGFIEAVTVKATVDGAFNITPSGTITFSEDVNAIPATTVAKDLGLIQGPDKLLVEVSQGVTMDYNITASQVINYGTDANENLMKLLGDITKHLDSKPEIPAGTTNPNYASDIKALTNADLEGIQKVMTNILKLRSEAGAKQNRMESAETRNEDQNFNMTEILSATEDIDITEKTMEYATMQTVYMASLQTSAKVLQPSLLDYLR